MQRTNVELSLAFDATNEGWAQTLKLKDLETEGHSRQVVQLTIDLARRTGIVGELLAHIHRGALLHEIRKMGVPDSMMQKPEKLTEEEWHGIGT